MLPKIVIIDDEDKARNNIKRMLDLLEYQANIIGEACDVESAYQLLSSTEPNVVFLDIKMPDGSGFDLLRKLGSFSFRVVFITAFDAYAIEAFRYNALDYLLKPINPEDFEQVLNKIQELNVEDDYREKMASLLSHMQIGNQSTKIVLKTNDSIVIAKSEDIIRCCSDRGYTDFYLKDGRTITVSQVIKTFEDKLTKSGFIKTHQSHLINPEYMQAFIKSDGGYILMTDKSTVPVSKRKKDSLMKYLDQL